MNNFPINSEFYEPSRFVISSILEGIVTVVSTTVDHNYVIGQQVRLLIPVCWGAYELNNKIGYVLSIPSAKEVVISIDSFGASPFILINPHPNFTQNAQIIAIGDINNGHINQTRTNNGTYIPGSFRDISND